MTTKKKPEKGSNNAGTEKLKAIVTEAKKIRKKDEKWTDAVKRASKKV